VNLIYVYNIKAVQNTRALKLFDRLRRNNQLSVATDKCHTLTKHLTLTLDGLEVMGHMASCVHQASIRLDASVLCHWT